MYKIICVAVLAHIAVVTLGASGSKTEELQNKFVPYANKCSSSIGVTQEEVSHDFHMNTGLSNKTGCFVSCMGKEFDWVNDKNLFDKSKVMILIDTLNAEDFFKFEFAKIKEMFTGCLDAQQAGTDPCVIGKKFTECVLAGMQKIELEARHKS